MTYALYRAYTLIYDDGLETLILGIHLLYSDVWPNFWYGTIQYSTVLIYAGA